MLELELLRQSYKPGVYVVTKTGRCTQILTKQDSLSHSINRICRLTMTWQGAMFGIVVIADGSHECHAPLILWLERELARHAITLLEFISIEPECVRFFHKQGAFFRSKEHNGRTQKPRRSKSGTANRSKERQRLHQIADEL